MALNGGPMHPYRGNQWSTTNYSPIQAIILRDLAFQGVVDPIADGTWSTQAAPERMSTKIMWTCFTCGGTARIRQTEQVEVTTFGSMEKMYIPHEVEVVCPRCNGVGKYLTEVDDRTLAAMERDIPSLVREPEVADEGPEPEDEDPNYREPAQRPRPRRPMRPVVDDEE